MVPTNHKLPNGAYDLTNWLLWGYYCVYLAIISLLPANHELPNGACDRTCWRPLEIMKIALVEHKITTCFLIDNVCGTTVRFCMTSVQCYFCCNSPANLQSWLKLIFFCAIIVVLNLQCFLYFSWGISTINFLIREKEIGGGSVYLIRCTFSSLLTPFPSSIRDKW